MGMAASPSMWHAGILLWAVFGLILGVTDTGAGTLCGTVRDGQTMTPIPFAGIFAFQQGGSYTGLHAASDANGWFCIDPIDAGIYDIQVKVDDYRTLWIQNVAVTGDQTGVALVTPVLSPPAPNPASDHVRFQFHLEEAGLLRLDVFDVRGRPVHGWEGAAPEGGTVLTWDLRERGRHVASGIYLVRLRAGRMTAVQKLIVAR
jgi:hypothetical protein